MRNPAFRLLMGDLFMLTLFVVFGKKEHGLEIINVETLTTALPMFFAWILAGWRTGAFTANATLSTVTKKTLFTTVLAVPIGLIIRSLLLGRSIGLLFFIVTLLFTFGFIWIWRFFYFWISRKTGGMLR
jgi:hypothetical protein